MRLGGAGALSIVLLAHSMAATAPLQSTDPFIAAIAGVKQSVAPVVCRARGNGGKPINGVQSVVGTVFFTASTGTFVTAAHVIADARQPNCFPAIYLPTEGWEPNTIALPIRLYNFSRCPVVDARLDIAICETDDDLSRDTDKGIRIQPVAFNQTRHPAGTQVAFLGFPLQETTPVAVRGSIAAYWSTGTLLHGELVIDQSAWGGMSGGPVFREDGTVIGIVTNRGTKTREGMTMARPAWFVTEIK